MRRCATYKVTAWLLMALWLFPLAVKSAHVHHYEECEGATEVAHHGCEDCLICQFTLSPCVEAFSPEVDSPPAYMFLIPAARQEKPYTSFYRSFSPRGPPETDVFRF
jgi:hypothetical protein